MDFGLSTTNLFEKSKMTGSPVSTLPSELIQLILSYLGTPPSNRYEYSDDELRSFHKSSNPLALYRDLSLVNKTVGLWAQDFLLPAPLIRDNGLIGKHLTPLVTFARTLLERPRFGLKIRRLTIVLPNRGAAKREVDALLTTFRAEISLILKKAIDYIASLDIPARFRQTWTKSLQTKFPYSLVGVILALVPNLKHLALITTPGLASDKRFDFFYDFFGLCARYSSHGQYLASAKHIGALKSLKFINVEGAAPFFLSSLDMFPNITTLYLLPILMQLQVLGWMRIRSDPIDYYGPLLASMPNLIHLDLQNIRYAVYVNLEDLIRHIPNPSLMKTMELSDGLLRQPLQCLAAFSALEKLTIPAPYLILRHAYTDRRPQLFPPLPPSLKQVAITRAEPDICHCIQTMIQEKLFAGVWRALYDIDVEIIHYHRYRYDLIKLREECTALVEYARAANITLVIRS
ncbi:hypothetical protein N0V90_010768 [Kalmusia sp. IMI 367209]|nr:hypothetical protein N0V90_010768 [Kalmusia sp. IMI 367209]